MKQVFLVVFILTIIQHKVIAQTKSELDWAIDTNYISKKECILIDSQLQVVLDSMLNLVREESIDDIKVPYQKILLIKSEATYYDVSMEIFNGYYDPNYYFEGELVKLQTAYFFEHEGEQILLQIADISLERVKNFIENKLPLLFNITGKTKMYKRLSFVSREDKKTQWISGISVSQQIVFRIYPKSIYFLEDCLTRSVYGR